MMKAVIQRVLKASVTVGDETVGSISRGLCVLVGINRNDTQKEMDFIVRKILNLKLFDDESAGEMVNGEWINRTKRWRKSVMDLDYEVICVSQFTLDVTLKGNNVDFHNAMGPDKSRAFYNQFLETLKTKYKPDKIQDGAFGEYMQVHIQNDGPITIPIEMVPQTDTKDKTGKQLKSSTSSKEPQAKGES